LKQELGRILPELEEMQKRKVERRNQFIVVMEQIDSITNDIKGQGELVHSEPLIDETNLSMRKLEELHCQLQVLQKEKVKFDLYLNILLLCFCLVIPTIILYLLLLWCCFSQIDRVETIRKHLCTLYSHCSVLGMDFNEVVGQVNPTLSDPEGPRSLSDHTIEKLGAAVQKLMEVKIQRMQRVSDILL